MGHPVAEVRAVLVPPVAIDAPHAPHAGMRDALPIFCPDHLIHGTMEGGENRDLLFVVFTEKAGDQCRLLFRKSAVYTGTGEAIEDHC
jgi:hypothetical protein